MTLKERINRGKALMGWIAIPSTTIAEIVAKAGFDAVVVDMEHSSIDISQLEVLFQVIEGGGSVPLVRLSSNDPVLTKRVLDLGAQGIIVPMIKSREEAQIAVQSAKYPPEGLRSTGIYRAQNYGQSFAEYRSSANERVIVILQIEHKDAVEKIDEILKVPGIDGIMIGPYDLSSSYGIAGQLDDPVMREAIKKVMNSARENNMKVGTHIVEPSAEKVKKALLSEFSFVVYSNDSIILSTHYSGAVQDIKS